MIKMIWAQSNDGVIGVDNELPWHLPADLHYFKENTAGKTIVMGRKTFQSIGEKPLPNRTNLVLTSKNYTSNFDNLFFYHSIQDLLNDQKEKELMVIGGKQVYEDFMPFAEELLVTMVDVSIDEDGVLAPEIPNTFIEISNQFQAKDEKNVFNLNWKIFKKGIKG